MDSESRVFDWRWAQLWPRLLQAFQQCQRQVAVQVALVELIQHHGGDTF